jgi:positive regulator of sigma E activity
MPGVDISMVPRVQQLLAMIRRRGTSSCGSCSSGSGPVAARGEQTAMLQLHIDSGQLAQVQLAAVH